MPDLPSKLFCEDRELTVAEAKKHVISCDEDIANILSEGGLNGGAACFVVLCLSPDNNRVDSGSFGAQGLEEREFRITASKVWQDAEPSISLTVRMPTMESFKFAEGGLTSDLVDDQELVHFFHRESEGQAPKPILDADLRNTGIGPFSVKLVCLPAASSGIKNGIRIKYQLMLFPSRRADLLKMSQHSNSPSWAGIKLCEGEMPMLPRATKAWGCPIFPLFRGGKPVVSIEDVPKGGLVRFAIAAIMGRCGAPDALKNGGAVESRWSKWVKSPSSFTTKPAPLSWPTVSPLDHSEG